jgi:hypothetical protein
MYVKWLAPGALALRGADLLVADLGQGRLWRADTLFNTVTALPGAVVGPQTRVALGADLSAWVLDPLTRQVLRFGRDGRLLQSFRATAPALPRGLALADAGQVLLLADGALGQWTELRAVGGQPVPVRPAAPGPTVQVDDLAVGRQGVVVLDAAAGCVHLVRRDGQWLQTLGQGTLRQPVALAVDRHDRVFVLEADARHLHVLQAGQPALTLGAEQLGVQQIGGIAIDEGLLAISDRLQGLVAVLHLGAPA